MKKNKSTHKLNRNKPSSHPSGKSTFKCSTFNIFLFNHRARTFKKLFPVGLPLVDSHEDKKKIFIVNTYKTLGTCVVESRELFPTATT